MLLLEIPYCTASRLTFPSHTVMYSSSFKPGTSSHRISPGNKLCGATAQSYQSQPCTPSSVPHRSWRYPRTGASSLTWKSAAIFEIRRERAARETRPRRPRPKRSDRGTEDSGQKSWNEISLARTGAFVSCSFSSLASPKGYRADVTVALVSWSASGFDVAFRMRIGARRHGFSLRATILIDVRASQSADVEPLALCACAACVLFSLRQARFGGTVTSKDR